MADKSPFEPATGSSADTDPRHSSDSTDDHEPAAVQAAGADIAAVQRDRDDYYDRLLRKTAEFDNYRKRVERERREHADQAVVDLLQDLLLVVDDFDLAMNVEAGDGAQAYK